MAFGGAKLLSAEKINSENEGLSLFLCSINYIFSLHKTRKKTLKCQLYGSSNTLVLLRTLKL